MSKAENQTSWTVGDIPPILTYVYPTPSSGGSRYQLQWDYQVEWPAGGQPTIKFLRFKSYQQKTALGELELVEDLLHDIPVNEGLMIEISKHASGYLFANSLLNGRWRLTDRTFLRGLQEVANKRFDFTEFRKMSQAKPNPEL